MSSLPYSSAPLFAVRCVLLQFRVARHPPYALAYLISWFSLFLQCAFFKIFFFRKLFFSYCFLSVFFLHNLLQDLFSICCVFSSNLCLRFSKIELPRLISAHIIYHGASWLSIIFINIFKYFLMTVLRAEKKRPSTLMHSNWSR